MKHPRSSALRATIAIAGLSVLGSFSLAAPAWAGTKAPAPQPTVKASPAESASRGNGNSNGNSNGAGETHGGSRRFIEDWRATGGPAPSAGDNPAGTQAGAAGPGASAGATNPSQSNPSNPSSPSKGDKDTRSDAGTTATPTGCPNTFQHVDTGHGANVSGAYDSTCDGSPSRNGNGNGNGGGQPCAGCVGNADMKNPKGQAPDGSDHNKGYECDGNNGIGRSNPAHSGCRPSTPTTTPPVSTCPDGTPVTDRNRSHILDSRDSKGCPSPPPTTTPTTTARTTPTTTPTAPTAPTTPVTVHVATTCPSGATMTDVNGDGVANGLDCSEVKGLSVDAPVSPAVVRGVSLAVAPAAAIQAAPGRSLAFTGSSSLQLAMLAGGLLVLGLGAWLFGVGRRSSRAS